MSALDPTKCVELRSTELGSTAFLAQCNGSLLTQYLLPIDFPMVFASTIQANVDYNGPIPPVAPLRWEVANKNFECMDLYLDGFLGLSEMDDFQCNGTDAQWFHFDGTGLLKTTTNSCVGIPLGPGNGVVTENCTGAPDQQWLYWNNALYNGQAQKSPADCLDVYQESTTPLTRLTTSPCAFGGRLSTVGQTWVPNLIFPKAKSMFYKVDYGVGAGWVQPSQPVFGDFNKDGFTDFAYVFKSDGIPGATSNGRVDIDVYLSEGASGNFKQNQRWSNELAGWVDGMTFYGGDFDGDGYADIAAVYDDGSGKINISVQRSNGSAFLPPEGWANESGAFIKNGVFYVGDYDGNGTTDFAYIFTIDGANIDIDTHLSQGSLANGGFAGPAHWAINQGGWTDISLHDPTDNGDRQCAACARTSEWVQGDFNGDRKTDLALVFSTGDGQIAIDTHLSTGSSFAWQHAVTDLGGWIDESDWIAQDMDNDGRADLVEIEDQFYDGESPLLSVYSSAISGMTIPAGTSGFVGGNWAAVPTPFWNTPPESCLDSKNWPILGGISGGNFVHQIGSGFGDVIFVEPNWSGGYCEQELNPQTIQMDLAY